MENSAHYKEVFGKLLKVGSYAPHMQDVLAAIKENGLSRQAVATALSRHGIDDVAYYKEDMLDLLLVYLNFILDDHAINDVEYRDFELLKKLFKIREGDFYTKRHLQVKEIIHLHLTHILLDGKITQEEAWQTVNLQAMFGLSQDQYEALEAHYLEGDH